MNTISWLFSFFFSNAKTLQMINVCWAKVVEVEVEEETEVEYSLLIKIVDFIW